MNLNTCLISKEPIQENITLPCGHSFEYIYLYEEIKQQKLRHKNYFKCPYCRHMYCSTIPYYQIDEVEKINSVNGNSKSILPIYKCTWTNCLKAAHKFKHGIYCWSHSKSTILKLCSATCNNGIPCKNKCKTTELCNVHSKKKINNTVINIE